MFENKKKILIVIGILIAVIASIAYYFVNNYSEQETFYEENIEEFANEETGKEDEKESLEEKEKIIVHVAGEVVNPGVISLKEGSRVIDAINEAGGATANADLSKINLAYVLSDAEKIYIPSMNEKDDVDVFGTSDYEGKQKIMVNINTANESELQKVPGIGQTIASRIVEYRKKNGKFKTAEDIQNVSGIGTSKFGKIKEYICVK